MSGERVSIQIVWRQALVFAVIGMALVCGAEPVWGGQCPGGGGDCCTGNGTPGCDDLTCCNSVCASDPFCCSTEWDDICGDEATKDENCNCGVQPCPGTGDCCTDNGTPGCDDAACCESVCASDPFCCSIEWDEICADEATKDENCDCTEDPACPGGGDCCTSNGTPGCDDAACCESVCGSDPFCCTVSWDSICADEAAADPNCDCEVEPACPGTGNCCTNNGTPGCDNEECCEAVCGADPFCCTVSWDSICAGEAAALCEMCVDLVLDLDIKPGACPNSFNRKSKGVLPVALLGDFGFDVATVDLPTVRLSRADGMGGFAAPNEGPPGPHSEIADVGTPFGGALCDCHDLEGDAINDLSMKFNSEQVVDELELNDLPPGALVELVLSGSLLDGTTFVARDCIRLVPPGTPNSPMGVMSEGSPVWVDLSPPDLSLNGGGVTNLIRTYPDTTFVSLTGPTLVNGRMLLGLKINGVYYKIPPSQSTGYFNHSLVITGATGVELVYEPVQFQPVPTPVPGAKSLTPAPVSTDVVGGG